MKLFILLVLSISTGLCLQRYTSPLYVSKPIQGISLAMETPQITPTPTPLKSDVVSYIAKTFETEGAHVMVKAIECFYSESGLRWNAYNDKNSNGTTDGGVAQLNSVHKMSDEDRFDYKKNIDKAYKIYKNRGNFSAWYGPLCNDGVASK